MWTYRFFIRKKISHGEVPLSNYHSCLFPISKRINKNRMNGVGYKSALLQTFICYFKKDEQGLSNDLDDFLSVLSFHCSLFLRFELRNNERK